MAVLEGASVRLCCGAIPPPGQCPSPSGLIPHDGPPIAWRLPASGGKALVAVRSDVSIISGARLGLGMTCG